MHPDDENYAQVGLISRLANGRVARLVGLATAALMLIPVLFWIVTLY